MWSAPAMPAPCHRRYVEVPRRSRAVPPPLPGLRPQPPGALSLLRLVLSVVRGSHQRLDPAGGRRGRVQPALLRQQPARPAVLAGALPPPGAVRRERAHQLPPGVRELQGVGSDQLLRLFRRREPQGRADAVPHSEGPAMKVGTPILGSGVVATVLTKKLLEKNPGMSILILEAGKRFKTKDFGIWTDYVATGNDPVGPSNPMYDYNYPERNIPGENAWVGTTQMPLNGGRAMTYGGSTVVWGGWSLRRKQEDFYLKTNNGEGLDWPFDYDYLEPYY